MYLYLYDALLKERQYERVIATLESRVAEFEINGRIVRLSSLLSPREIILQETRRKPESHTVVIVGDDMAFTKIIHQTADLPVTFGWVPVGPDTDLAERLGLPYGALAAPVLSRRKIAHIDIGCFNQYFFIDHCLIPLSTVTLALDGKFAVSATAQKMSCSIWNIPPSDKSILPRGYTPISTDGQMEIVLQPVAKKGLFGLSIATASIFPFREVRIKVEKAAPVVVDGHVIKESQMKILLAEERPLKLILSSLHAR